MNMNAEKRKNDPIFQMKRRRLAKYWPHALIKDNENKTLTENEKNLLSGLQGWKEVITNAGANILISTPEGEICYVGKPNENNDYDMPVGFLWQDFVPEDQQPLMKEKIKECVEKKVSIRYEISAFSADLKETFFYDIVLWPIIENKEVIGLMSLSFDISEKKRIDARLMHLSQMAAMGEILGAISHEINNPLAVIQLANNSVLSNLDKEKDLVKITNLSKKIKQATERISKTIQTVRNLFRPVGNNGDYFNVDEVFSEMQSLSFERFKNAGIEFKVMPSVGEFYIKGDQNAFSHCLLNLINNAYDFVKDTPAAWVGLEYKTVDNKILVTVSDSGVMPDDVRRKVLKTSFTTKARGVGTGLGLGLCRRIVNDMGGAITLDETCANTRFVIELEFVSEKSRMAS